MIVVRDIRGKALELAPDARFIEICDTERKPAVVFFMDDKNRIVRLEPGDPGFDTYTRNMRVENSELRVLPSTITAP